jgi:Dolichyl-phosphate-mannose-protein mannosyltransferase
MSTTAPVSFVAPPAADTRRQAIQLALAFALAKFLLHLLTNLIQPHLGWGYFRDELYYIACGQHLAFGYVDHPPMVALQARLALMLFGKSLAGIRMFSSLAGAAKVFLTGLLCWRLGGSRWAQALAMLAVLQAGQFLGLDSYLSMNSFEPVFWMTCLYAIVVMLQGASPRWWIVFGISAGLGLETKDTIVFFLLSLLAALLLTRERRVLFAREYCGWAALGVALLIGLALPNLLWQIHNHWPTLEFLHDGVVQHKNIPLPAPQFIKQQIFQFNPISSLLWIAGLLWLLIARVARPWRWIGLTYVIFLVLMIGLHAKDYYLAPIYPVLFAAGGVVFFAPKVTRNPARPWWQVAYGSILLITGALILPAAIPVMRAEQQLGYLDRMHLHEPPREKWAQGPLPQFFSDRFGWQEQADAVTRVYNSLSPEDKARCGIFASNYGKAGAINFLAPAPADGSKLPLAVSGQNNYFLWGPNGYTGDVMILVTSVPIEDVRQVYGEVTIADRADSQWAMPYERLNIYLCRHRKSSFSADWEQMKDYI